MKTIMPRKTRLILPQIPHHAVQRGNNKQKIFSEMIDRNIFFQYLKNFSKEENIQISAYCLMSNHVHFLLYPNSEEELIRFMKHLFQSYTQYFNKQYSRSGKLWENRYKIHIVDPDCEWIVCRYIELNPVRANMVKNPEDYSYSSAKEHITAQRDGIINKDIINGRYKEYHEFLIDQLAMEEEHIDRIRKVTQQQKVYGNREFIENLEKRYNINCEVRARGRPCGIK
ncbi:MAG: hypothetical protein GF384_07455 [Elusimicrobia bacterium]|nr:hypothetical protein [Elusimicrobiota bacterium]MBD3412493.1 hypothetical protein [Elusimicrobiota bacterium]